MKLYELADEWRKLAATLEENGGELTPGMEEEFAALEGDTANKVRNIVALIRELQVDADAVKAEADRVAKLAKAKQSAADRLKAYLQANLEAAGIDRLDVGIAKLAIQKASRPTIRWNQWEPAPEEFTRATIVLDGDKTYDAYRAGTLPDGFAVTFTTFLTIR